MQEGIANNFDIFRAKPQDKIIGRFADRLTPYTTSLYFFTIFGPRYLVGLVGEIFFISTLKLVARLDPLYEPFIRAQLKG